MNDQTRWDFDQLKQRHAELAREMSALAEQLKHLEDQGVLRRKPGVFRQTGAGDALELTPEGYKSVR